MPLAVLLCIAYMDCVQSIGPILILKSVVVPKFDLVKDRDPLEGNEEVVCCFASKGGMEHWLIVEDYKVGQCFSKIDCIIFKS